MPLFASYSNMSNQRRWLYIAAVLLLAVAQMFSQLHSLEHLDEHEGEEHSEISCSLCILSADLGNSIPAFGKVQEINDGSESRNGSGISDLFFLSLHYGFLARAPPEFLEFS